MSQPTDEHALWTLIKDIKFGMLTHPHTDGQLHSAPVTTHNKAGDEGLTLYFFISRKSEIASCIAKDGNVNVSYAHPGEDSYVSVSGHAAIVEDQTQKRRPVHIFRQSMVSRWCDRSRFGSAASEHRPCRILGRKGKQDGATRQNGQSRHHGAAAFAIAAFFSVSAPLSRLGLLHVFWLVHAKSNTTAPLSPRSHEPAS